MLFWTGEESDSIHRQLGTWLSDRSFAGLLTVGKEAEAILKGVRNSSFVTYKCPDATDVINVLRSRLNTDAAVLVDGSDSADLRKVISGLITESVQ